MPGVAYTRSSSLAMRVNTRLVGPRSHLGKKSRGLCTRGADGYDHLLAVVPGSNVGLNQPLGFFFQAREASPRHTISKGCSGG